MRVSPWIRFVVLAVFAAANISAIYFEPQPDALATGLAMLAGFVPALAYFRNAGLALAAVLAPLPGVLWFGGSDYGLCMALALVAAAGLVEAKLKEEDRRAVLVRSLVAIAAVLLLAAAWSFHAPIQIAGLAGGSIATVIFLPLLFLAVPFGEEAIARANRRRESLQRFSAVLAHIAEPRWSLSLSGAGLVLATLGWFEIPVKPQIFDGLAAAGAAVIILAVTRDIRAGLGALAAAGLLLLFSGGVSDSLLLFVLIAVLLGQTVAARRKEGEAVAWTRALEDLAAAILFAGLMAVIAAIPLSGPNGARQALYGVIAALILFPAFAGGLHAVFPRRRSVEELYRANAS